MLLFIPINQKRDLNMITSNEDEQSLVYTSWPVRPSIFFLLFLSTSHVCPTEPQTAHSGVLK